MEAKTDGKGKVYQKPSWEKQQMFERFTMACKVKSCSTTGQQNQLRT
jgi:hypothetical protein